MVDEWKDLYKKTEEQPPQHTGPLLFYNDLVVDHFTNPRNVGELGNPDGEAVVGDPSCGDQMKVEIKVDNNKIVDIKFKSYGCPGAIATSTVSSIWSRKLIQRRRFRPGSVGRGRQAFAEPSRRIPAIAPM